MYMYIKWSLMPYLLNKCSLNKLKDEYDILVGLEVCVFHLDIFLDAYNMCKC